MKNTLFALLLVFLATFVMWLLRDTLTLANFSLLYLLVVLLIAIRAGIGPSLLAAFVSFLCFNFFLVRPFYTFAVADPRELLDLFIFLVVAVITGQLANQARHEAERARQSAAFEEADRLKTALLRAVSHDLRTPITIIKTSVSNLLHLYDQLPVNEREDMLKTIEGEADHLNKMVGNVLDLSRLQAGALQLNLALNSLEEIAGEVAARVWQTHKAERIKIIFPDNMPLVAFDYGLLLQALTNLVDNALRYEPKESLVEMRGSFDAAQARLAVVNHGANIAPAERDQMMQPFYHGRDGHIGLGLPIAKGIVEAHHGTIRLDDTLGGGATFVLSLPLALESVELSHENSRGG